ncbi:phosphatidate cytidylyltransferase [Enterococcus nangangensis]|uniref:phosphatidate cytidylyltransferase n=1 Tax=Enterococcus nangangensis TaxID=2559926 RepID=UPI0010F74CC5|nr:phosphatidate cytidylyltransferase [Enterococcus nangangensis]
MRQRVITAVIALIVFIPIIVYGGLAVELAGGVLAVIGLYELFKMKGLTLLSFEGVVSVLGTLVLVLPLENWFFFLPQETNHFTLFYFFVMVLLAAQVVSKNTYTIDEAAFPVIASLYVGMGFQMFVAARNQSLVVLLFALFIVWATDIGAYMFGRQFGKNKLWPEISPNKTIEGSLGGLLSAVVVAAIFLLLYPGAKYFGVSTGLLLVYTMFFSAAGQFGDLVESAIKRHYDVKDSGNILPGHGGILDRFDSMLFVFPLMHLFGLF